MSVAVAGEQARLAFSQGL